MPAPLDEYPIHQVPLSMAEVATSDRNAYDRCYLNAHDRTGETFVITGLGVYPNLGVADAYATVRHGDVLRTVRCSDTIFEDRLHQRVGPYRIEVVEPLHRLRVVLETEELAFDLAWEGSFACIDEPRHVLQAGPRVILDGRRFAQLGSWSGWIDLDGERLDVTPDRWVGSRDRSWGIRPVGEAEPPGRPDGGPGGFWWLYAPLRFDDFALVVILQEDPDGERTLNAATRVWADGRVEQLGWPEVDLRYRSGSRHPEHATLHLTGRDRRPITVEIDTLGYIPLHLGPGYGGEDWAHGRWKGPGWVDHVTHDLRDPDVASRVPWGVVDHVARATCDGATGWGLFEHASLGRHDPTGFAGWDAVAP